MTTFAFIRVLTGAFFLVGLSTDVIRNVRKKPSTKWLYPISALAYWATTAAWAGGRAFDALIWQGNGWAALGWSAYVVMAVVLWAVTWTTNISKRIDERRIAKAVRPEIALAHECGQEDVQIDCLILHEYTLTKHKSTHTYEFHLWLKGGVGVTPGLGPFRMDRFELVIRVHEMIGKQFDRTFKRWVSGHFHPLRFSSAPQRMSTLSESLPSGASSKLLEVNGEHMVWFARRDFPDGYAR